MSAEERPLSTVPAWLWAFLFACVALQLGWRSTHPPTTPEAADLPAAPSPKVFRLASLGEPQAMSRLAMLYLQAFDLGGANAIPYQKLDYSRLVAWLGAVLELDPLSEYPLFSAARVYAENPDPAKSRIALEFVYEAFLKDPDRRWQWLAHAALLAKHRLDDLPLARRYAAAIDRHTSAPDVPLWARQMEVFILEDMGELEAATIMLGGLLESGQIQDPAELRFLQQRLGELKERVRTRQN